MTLPGTMWPWRDWVIRAFNANMPYDQFVVEQLAGDLLPDPTLDQIVATGFNRNNRTVTEAGSLPEEWLVENVVDRVETTSSVFLGLTMGCCRCHDHKYDPISQKEFYEFFAFFNNITERGVYQETRGNVAPLIKVPTVADSQRLSQLEAEIETLAARLSSAVGEYLAGDDLLTRRSDSDAHPPAAVRFPLDGNAIGLAATGERLSPVASTELNWADSLFGKSILIQNGGVAYKDVASSDREQAYTALAWISPNGGGTVFSKMNSPEAYRGVDLLLLDDRRPAVHMIHRWPDNAIKVVGKKPIPLHTWTHVAVTYDGSSKAAGVKLYINGELAELNR